MKTLLIVDDSKIDRVFARTLSQKLGLETQEASSGTEALELCSRALPDGIILDWGMEVMNGIEFIRKLRAMKCGQGVYIVMHTPNEHASHVGHAYVTGATAYMVKPITQKKLEEKLIAGGLIGSSAA